MDLRTSPSTPNDQEVDHGPENGQHQASPSGARRSPATWPWTLHRTPRTLLALAVVVALCGLWLHFADAGFTRREGLGDWVGSRIGVFANNYVRYGLTQSAGAQVLNVAPLESLDEAIVYRGHPPAVPLAVAAVFWLTGSRAPWAHRLLPFLASLVSLALMARLARHGGLPASLVVVCLAGLPLFVWHGGTPSYEPFCLAAMLVVLVAYERGWRMRLAPLIFVGCLIDFPCIYTVPALVVAELRARYTLGKGRCFPLRSAFVWSIAGLMAMGLHFAHVASLDGGLTGQWNQSIQAKIWDALSRSDLQPSFVDFIVSQWQHARLGFGLPWIVVATVGVVLAWRKIGLVAWTFFGAAALHVLIFRWHAVRHDFWLYYSLPAVAIAATHTLQRLGKSWSTMTTAGLVAYGWSIAWPLWAERAAVPATEVAVDIRAQFPAAPVLHQARGPEACSIDLMVDRSVFNLADLMTQAAQTRSFRDYIDGIALFGEIEREQLAYLHGPGTSAADVEVMERFFPSSRRENIRGVAGPYFTYDITRYIRDPGQSPTLLAMLGEGECLLHREWVRIHAVLDAFPRGAKLWWVTESLQVATKRVRGRTVRIGNASERPEPGRAWTMVAWPEPRRRELLERMSPGRLAEAMPAEVFGKQLRLHRVDD